MKAGEFNITYGVLGKFDSSDNWKSCEAAAFGADAKKHADECPSRLQTLIREDDVLKARLDLRDVRRRTMSEEELKVDDLMEETEDM